MIIPRSEADQSVKVPARTVDSLVESKLGCSLLFKIDVEGYELSVLKGMARLLRDHHPYAGTLRHGQALSQSSRPTTRSTWLSEGLNPSER